MIIVSQPFYYIVINILVTSSEILWKFWNFWNFEIFWKFWNLMKFFEKLKCLKFFLLIMVFFDLSAWDCHIGPEGRYESRADTRADMENAML
jgi:hypothetical protein